MNKFKLVSLILFLIVLICDLTFLHSQSISQLEQSLLQVHHQLSNEQSKIDSLQIIYDKFITSIENEKRKPNPDKSKIRSQLAQAVVLSNQIESEQIKLKTLENRIDKQRKTLDAGYAQMIDSLKHLEADKNFKGDRDELNWIILTLYEKRIALNPSANMLSYNPQKLLSIDINKKISIEEKIIYRDYLENALLESELKLKDVTSLNQKIDQAIKLEKKLSSFIADAEFNAGIRNIVPQKSSNVNTKEARQFDYTPGTAAEAMQPQIQSFFMLYNQLNIRTISAIDQSAHWASLLANENFDLSLEDYSKLLKEIELRLNDYNSLLKNKLDRLSDKK